MTSDESSHETWAFRFRKKVRKLSLLVLEAGKVVWRPQPGRTFILSEAYLKIRTSTGTNTDAPSIKLTDGTTDVVAAVDTSVVEGAYQRLTVTGNAVFTNDAPLTLVIGDAPAGSTVLDMDLVLVATKLSD